MHGTKELLRRDIIDFGQSYKLTDRQIVFFSFQAVKPAGRDLVGRVAPPLCEGLTPLFDLSQSELPVLPNCPKSRATPFGHELLPIKNGTPALHRFVDIFACTRTEPIFVPIRDQGSLVIPALRWAEGQLYTLGYEAFSLNRE
jgi:hypothetical protein